MIVTANTGIMKKMEKRRREEKEGGKDLGRKGRGEGRKNDKRSMKRRN